MLRCNALEDDELGRCQAVYGFGQARFVSASGVFLDDALLHGLIDKAERAGKNCFCFVLLPGFNCSSELSHLRFELVPVRLIESLQFQALTMPL